MHEPGGPAPVACARNNRPPLASPNMYSKRDQFAALPFEGTSANAAGGRPRLLLHVRVFALNVAPCTAIR